MDNNNRQQSASTGKQAPQSVSGKNEEQAKEKTMPLQDETKSARRVEGGRKDGEPGAGIKQ